ncbi:MAG: phosphoribosyl-AMP cyclohydrolase [Rickettsiales bacterium]|jgi:phosphoribosyl-AMP cyclohydrolase|nr:phosphoribosyl-AMP cyclohydrolase [Rickettsiales bacterium]
MTPKDTDVEGLVKRIKWNEQGLIPVVAQEASTHEVLMLAWMNAEALRLTLTTGQVTYWSRSRSSLWRKGETSGHVQKLMELRLDCDADSLLLLVNQTGPACHTGEKTCFFREI